MRRSFSPAILCFTASLCAVGTLSAQEEDQGPARLGICNKGNRSVSVALALHNLDLLAPTLRVDAWHNVEPGECSDVYDFQSASYIPEPAYLAFAYFDGQGLFTPARLATVPDIGAWTHQSTYMALRFPSGSGLALSRASKRLCVNQGPLGYSVPLNSEVSCASLHPDGVEGTLVPIVAQVFFHPSARRCSRMASYEDFTCGGGRYYLDVAPKAGDLELRATRSVGHEDESVAVQRTPEQNAADLAEGLRTATDMARTFVNTGRLPIPGAHEPSPLDVARPQWWKAPMQSPGSYQPSWIGQIVVVRGTVSRIVERPMFTSISFKESPKDALVGCPYSANLLRRMFGTDLNALVGKTLELTGEVERFGPCSPGASIRIFEAEQVRMASAR